MTNLEKFIQTGKEKCEAAKTQCLCGADVVFDREARTALPKALAIIEVYEDAIGKQLALGCNWLEAGKYE